jgi:pyridoxine 4-dehydrogenase
MLHGITAASAGTVRIGDRSVNRLGLGTNRLTDSEGSRTLLRRAIELGVNFIDTADVYQAHASEITIGNTLGRNYPDVLVATKGGMLRNPGGLGVDGHPDYLRSAVEGSLQRLQVDAIELYQLHRVDPQVPIESSLGTLKELQQDGKIRRIGLANVTVEEIERARRVAPIVSVQNEYNILQREHEKVLEFCEKQSLAFIPWTPIARGRWPASTKLGALAARLGVTPSQLALSWLLKRSPVMLPIPGTLSLVHLEENLASSAIELSDEDLHELDE